MVDLLFFWGRDGFLVGEKFCVYGIFLDPRGGLARLAGVLNNQSIFRALQELPLRFQVSYFLQQRKVIRQDHCVCLILLQLLLLLLSLLKSDPPRVNGSFELQQLFFSVSLCIIIYLKRKNIKPRLF